MPMNSFKAGCFLVSMKANSEFQRIICESYIEILVFHQSNRNISSVFLDSCNQVHTLENGSIKSPNYPNYYPSYAKCHYLINITDPNKRILIEFLQFSLEVHSSCAYDSVKIYDGTNTNAPIIGRVKGYCGNRKPSAMMSSGNTLLMVFVSDGGTQSSGFFIAYKTVGMFFMMIHKCHSYF